MTDKDQDPSRDEVTRRANFWVREGHDRAFAEKLARVELQVVKYGTNKTDTDTRAKSDDSGGRISHDVLR